MILDTSSITIRIAVADDETALVNLAALDSAGVPEAPVLLAEVDGQLRAALSVPDGTVVADPFFLTEDLITLLRARSLPGARRRRSPKPLFRPRYA